MSRSQESSSQRQLCKCIWSKLFAECEKSIQLYLESVDSGDSDEWTGALVSSGEAGVLADATLEEGASEEGRLVQDRKGVAEGEHVLSASSTCATTSMDEDLQNEKQPPPPWPASLGGKQVSSEDTTAALLPPAKGPATDAKSTLASDLETSDSDSSNYELPLTASSSSRDQSVSLIKPHHRYLDIAPSPSPSVSESSDSSTQSASLSPRKAKSAGQKEMSGHLEATSSWLTLEKQVVLPPAQNCTPSSTPTSTVKSPSPSPSRCKSISNVVLSSRPNLKVRLRAKKVHSLTVAEKAIAKRQVVGSHDANSAPPAPTGNCDFNSGQDMGDPSGQRKSDPLATETGDQRGSAINAQQVASDCRVNCDSAVESIEKSMATVAPVNLPLKSPKAGDECNRSGDVLTVANLLMTLQQSSCIPCKKDPHKETAPDHCQVKSPTELTTTIDNNNNDTNNNTNNDVSKNNNNRLSNPLNAVVEDEIDTAVASIMAKESHSSAERSPETPALAIDDSVDALTTQITDSPTVTCEEEAPASPAKDSVVVEVAKDKGKGQLFSMANMSPITPVSSPEQVSDCTMSQVMADTSNGDTESTVKATSEEEVRQSVTSGDTLVEDIVLNSSATATAQVSISTTENAAKATLQVLDTVAKAVAIAIDGSDDDDDDDLIRVSNTANIVKTGDGQYILYEDLHYQLMASTAVTAPAFDASQPLPQQQQTQAQSQSQQHPHQRKVTPPQSQGRRSNVAATPMLAAEAEEPTARLAYRCTVPGCNLNRLVTPHPSALEDAAPVYAYGKAGPSVQPSGHGRSLNGEYPGAEGSKLRGQGMLLPQQAYEYQHPQRQCPSQPSTGAASRTSDKSIGRNIHPPVGPLDMLMQQVSSQMPSKRYPPLMVTVAKAFNEQRSSIARTTYFNRSYHDTSQMESPSQYLNRSGEVSINESVYSQRPAEETSLSGGSGNFSLNRSYSHQSYSQVRVAGQTGAAYPQPYGTVARSGQPERGWPTKPPLLPVSGNPGANNSVRQVAGSYPMNQCQPSPLMSMYARGYPQTQAETGMAVPVAGGPNYHQTLHQQTQAPASINLQTGKVNHHQQPPHSQNMYCYPSMPHGASTSDSRYICNDKYCCRYTQGYSGCVHNPHRSIQSINESTNSTPISPSPFTASSPTVNVRTSLGDQFYQTKGPASTGQNQMTRQPPVSQVTQANNCTPLPFNMGQASGLTNHLTNFTIGNMVTPHSPAVQVIQSGHGYRTDGQSTATCQARSYGHSASSPSYSQANEKSHAVQASSSSLASVTCLTDQSQSKLQPHSNSDLMNLLITKSQSEEGISMPPPPPPPTSITFSTRATNDPFSVGGDKFNGHLEEGASRCDCKTGRQCGLHPQVANSSGRREGELDDSAKPVSLSNSETSGGSLKRKYHLDTDNCTAKEESTSSMSQAPATTGDPNNGLETSDPFACLKDPFGQSSPLIALAIACASQVDDSSLKQMDSDTGKNLHQVDLNNNSLAPTPSKMARVDY